MALRTPQGDGNGMGGDIERLIRATRDLAAEQALRGGAMPWQPWLGGAAAEERPIIPTLLARIDDALAEAMLGFEEAAEMLEAVNRISAADAPGAFETPGRPATVPLPLCSSPPAPLPFEGRLFCFAGTFAFGRLGDCTAAVAARGGQTAPLGPGTRVLVIGRHAAPDWQGASYGATILHAAAMRDRGVPISIVDEETWQRWL